jgi:hypothetical protein
MLEASYQVSLKIAKMCKPHTIVGNLILPVTTDMVKAVIGSGGNPLSNNTVSRRTDEMADDICEQLIQNIKESDFIATQYDKSINVLNLAQFSCFVR